MKGEGAMRAIRYLPILLVLAGCVPPPPAQPLVSLPETARIEGAGDPTRGAIISTAYVFGQPASIAGDAAAGAEALARLEYLAVELATGPRWIGLDPLVAPMLAQGRAEARAAFGLDPNAPPQRAVEALYGTAAALRAGDRARAEATLAPLTGTERAGATIARFAAFPFLPAAANATSRAQAAMNAMDSGGRGPPPLLF
jgi:hypothetical protein